MRWFDQISFIVKSLFLKRKLDEQLSEEIRTHVEMATEANVAAGMRPDQAHYAALRQFGNVAGIQERAREGRGWIWLEQLGQDIRYAARGLAKAPRFVAAAVASLALGIGATVSALSIARQALYPPIPFANPENIVTMEAVDPRNQSSLWMDFAPRYLRARERVDIFASLAASRPGTFNLVVEGQVSVVQTASVTPDFFKVFATAPVIGRQFAPDEYSGGSQAEVAILSYQAWLKQFGGDPGVAGSVVKIGDRQRLIIGVMPRNFRSPVRLGQWDVLLPIADSALPATGGLDTRVFVAGRLQTGITPDQAQAMLGLLTPADPKERAMIANWIPHLFPLRARYVADAERLFGILLGAAACFYLLTMANTTNLMLARLAYREHELAIRLAVGGGRARVVRLILLECLVLATLGAVAGIGVAYGSCAAFVGLLDAWIPAGYGGLSLSISTMSVAMVLGVGACVLAGVLSAWRSVNSDLNLALKAGVRTATGSRRMRLLRQGLIVGQTGLAAALLVGGVLMLRTFVNLRHTGVGVSTERKLAVIVQFPSQYPAAAYDRIGDTLRGTVARIPGVKGVVLSLSVPFSGLPIQEVVKMGAPGDETPLWCLNDMVSSEYFEVMGVALAEGRGFAGSNSGDPLVAIINESLGKKLFPGKSPVGQSLRTSSRGDLEIVGVARDLRIHGPREREPLQFYTPFQQRPAFMTFVQTLLVSFEGATPPDFQGTFSRLAYDAEPRLTVGYLKLSENVDWQVRGERVALIVLQVLSGLSVALAGFGLFAVMAFTVTQQEKEFSIRLVLGATVRMVLLSVVADGLRCVALGVLFGLGLAAGTTRWLQSLLFEVGAHDAVTFVGTAILLMAVGVSACLLPAWRAAKTDPMVALRAE